MGTVQSVALSDGRVLAFACYGAADGRPVVYLHGAASSRLEGELYDEDARAAGVRIIAPDRLGCGGSSPHPGRTFAGYARDIQELADALAIPRFVVAGMSNGGVYALPAAAELPDRVTSAIPINASTPLHDPVARRAVPFGVRLSYALVRHSAGVTTWSLKRLARSGRADDRARRSAREVLRQPGAGYIAEEIRMASADWGYDHAAILQPVEMFTGDKDPGYLYARLWAERLPSGRLHVFEGGHGGFAAAGPRANIVSAMAAAA